MGRSPHPAPSTGSERPPPAERTVEEWSLPTLFSMVYGLPVHETIEELFPRVTATSQIAFKMVLRITMVSPAG